MNEFPFITSACACVRPAYTTRLCLLHTFTIGHLMCCQSDGYLCQGVVILCRFKLRLVVKVRDSSSTATMASVPSPKEFKPGVADWSTVHESTGALQPSVDRQSWGQYRLPSDTLEGYKRDGFIANIKVLSDEQCDRLLHDYRYFMGEEVHPGMGMMYEYHRNQTADPNNVLMHALGHWRLTQLFHDLVFLPQIVVPVSQCLGDKAVRFWHDQMFAKPAFHGGVVAWHQDYSYWTRTQPMCHMTVHIALEDQTEDNGTIKYIPGSHKWTRNGGPLPVLDFNFKDMEGIKTILTEDELSTFKPVSAMLKKGEASFHHALSVHGSYGNRSRHNRRAAVLNYFADGTYSNSEGELLQGTGIIPKGQKMEGQFYPLVFDPAWTM